MNGLGYSVKFRKVRRGDPFTSLESSPAPHGPTTTTAPITSPPFVFAFSFNMPPSSQSVSTLSNSNIPNDMPLVADVIPEPPSISTQPVTTPPASDSPDFSTLTHNPNESSESSISPTSKSKPISITKKSLWDYLPYEIKTTIFDHADPLTRHLNNHDPPPHTYAVSNIKAILEQVLILNWNGDYSLLPNLQCFRPSILNGLDHITSKQVYKKLCKLWPNLAKFILYNDLDLFRGDGIQFSESIPTYQAEFEYRVKSLEKADYYLIHVPFRQYWIDDIPEWCLNPKMDLDRALLVVFFGRFGHYQVLKGLVDRWHVECKDGTWQNHLFVLACQRSFEGAATNGYLDVVELLMGLNVISSLQYQTAITNACRHGHVKLTKLLMQKASNFVCTDKLIDDIVMGRNIEILDLVLKQQRTVSLQLCQRFVNVAIKMAALHNNVKIVEHLLENFDVDEEGVNMGIQGACESMTWNVVKVLVLTGKADLKLNQEYFLSMAFQRGDLDVIRMMKASGQFDFSYEGNYPIGIACGEGHLDVVEFLVESCGVDPAVCYNMPIINACTRGRVDIVRYLLGLGSGRVDPGAGFRMACIGGHVEVVNVLLQCRNVDPASRDNEALRSACEYGRCEIVTILLRIPTVVDPACCDNEPLRLASKSGHLEVVKLLLALGDRVDPAARDNEAFRGACGSGNVEL
ncbi:hypothetical protein HDU76_009288, partial [Blyttiomyces sp. JEL0837]